MEQLTSKARSICAMQSADHRVHSPEGKSISWTRRPRPCLVRPRGWHLVEKHFAGRWRADVGIAVRFRTVLFPQCEALLRTGTGPYFYLPKMESHLEARLWNDVFVFAQDGWGCRTGRFAPRC